MCLWQSTVHCACKNKTRLKECRHAILMIFSWGQHKVSSSRVMCRLIHCSVTLPSFGAPAQCRENPSVYMTINHVLNIWLCKEWDLLFLLAAMNVSAQHCKGLHIMPDFSQIIFNIRILHMCLRPVYRNPPLSHGSKLPDGTAEGNEPPLLSTAPNINNQQDKRGRGAWGPDISCT